MSQASAEEVQLLARALFTSAFFFMLILITLKDAG